MKDIKISYMIVAQNINYVKVNDGDIQFSIVEPLVSIHIPEFPTLLKCRVAFTATGMEYGEAYRTFFKVNEPDGKVALEKEKKIVCDTHSVSLVVTTFVQDIEITLFEPGKYTFEAGFRDVISEKYTLHVWQGEV
ncbi:hypothetical protein [Paenibacillus sp. ACRRY]|uniref:hypothetical protein n=1 Tax=Paenibacillus sp. ACRRY TaxID=2918208 RepID=UPI001EF68AC1|nr:hypothetical protein [Paenibacillus sp. ACRRY]MCG7385131.1 hypothetical protein [Paenibacillus sp. ACRRY]